MLTLQFILADGVTIKLGDNVWTFGTNFIIYLIVAAVIGLVAEALVGRTDRCRRLMNLYLKCAW